MRPPAWARLTGTWLLYVATALPGAPAKAAEVRIHTWTYDYEDVVLWHLRSSFMHHAVAAVDWFAAAIHGEPGWTPAFSELQAQYMTATFAEFEYVFMVDGKEHTRTYYAKSGADAPRGDAAEGRGPPFGLFLRTAPTETHAMVLPSDASRLTWTALDDGRPPDARRNDAELKAVRSIERDMQIRRVPRGGEVVAFVSQAMCASCERAVRMFSAQYDIDVTINVLGGPESWASNRFLRRRRAFFQAAMTSLPPVKPGGGGPGPTPPPPGAPAWCPAPGRVQR